MAKQPKELYPTVTAGSKYVRISAYKVRAVADLIRGKQVDEARRILAFTPKSASHEISKVLESAIANAEHNFEIPQDELVVKVASADEGVTIKRFRARAQGRGYRIRKRTCHINLTLERQPQEELQSPTRPRRPQKATTTKPTEEPTAEAKPKRPRKKAQPPAEGTPSASSTEPQTQEKKESRVNKDDLAEGTTAPVEPDSGSSTRPNQPDQAGGTARIEAGSGVDDPTPAPGEESGKDKEGEA